jgi:hypothetical protein
VTSPAIFRRDASAAVRQAARPEEENGSHERKRRGADDVLGKNKTNQ